MQAEKKFPDDVFALDFSEHWNGRRNAPPRHLAEVKRRNRFGQEVFHLSYNRISGSDDQKIWLCGEMAMEIAGALKLFAGLAPPHALDDITRARLGSVTVKVLGDDGDLVEEILMLSHANLATAAGATSFPPDQFRGGTINVRNIELGS